MIGEMLLTTGLNTPKGYHSLERTHERYYEHNPYGDQLSLFEPYTSKKTRTELYHKNSDPFSIEELSYGALDIVTCHKVYEKQLKRLEEQELLKILEIENEFTLVLGDKELNGFPLDIPRWCELDKWANNKLEEKLGVLRKEYPEVEN